MARKNLQELIDGLLGPRRAGEALGPKEAALEARFEQCIGVGLTDIDVFWGPKGAAMSREERAAAAVEFLDALRQPMSFRPRTRGPRVDLANLGRGEMDLDDYIADLVATA